MHHLHTVASLYFRYVSDMTYGRGGQSAARETILCGPRALTKIYTSNVNQAKDDFFLQLCAECQ